MIFPLTIERWLTPGQIRRIPAFVTASVLLVAATGWWIHAIDSRKLAMIAPEAGPTPVSLSWKNDRVMDNVDLFTLISAKASGTKLYTLSTHDRSTYQRIFDAQANNDWARANALIKRLGDDILVGHILYDRYINSADYRASYAELREWMVKYGDHPNAYRVYQLAQKRRANNPATLPAPQMAKKLLGSLELALLSKDIKKTSTPKLRNNAAVRDLTHKVKSYLAMNAVTRAYDYLGQAPAAKTLTAIEYDTLLSEIAAGYYYNHKYDTAMSVAVQATKRSKEAVPYAAWIGGLSAWQQGHYDVAARQFALIPKSHSRSPWMMSAGAFWAARAFDKIGDEDAAEDYLLEAASFPRTFYGLIAQAKLGKDVSFSWETPALSGNLINALKKHPSGERALALMDVGQKELAAKELKQIHPESNRLMEKALVAAASHFNLPSLAMQLGNAVDKEDGNLYDVALYPVVPWKGDETAGVDPALLNALIRQESKFDAEARNSRSGATGLMQLMPRTAKFVSDASFNARDITKPEVNVALGQRYVRYLLEMERVDGNMLYLAAAYNAGPGNLARWQKKIDYKGDPLLFIESIPLSETRAYVERVMTNYWIYNQRLGQEDSTLRQLAKDSWPVYRTRGSVKMASN